MKAQGTIRAFTSIDAGLEFFGFLLHFEHFVEHGKVKNSIDAGAAVDDPQSLVSLLFVEEFFIIGKNCQTGAGHEFNFVEVKNQLAGIFSLVLFEDFFEVFYCQLVHFAFELDDYFARPIVRYDNFKKVSLHGYIPVK